MRHWIHTTYGTQRPQSCNRQRTQSSQSSTRVTRSDAAPQRGVFDTTQVEAEKRRTDLFRHWILGFGAGDLIIKVPSQSLQIELPNVLFVDRRVTEIADLMKTKPVMTE